MTAAMLADVALPVIGGVDTHKHTHVAAVVDHLGGHPTTRSFPNTAQGHRELLAWMAECGSVAQVGIEGTGSYGAGLMRHLRAQGLTVLEVRRPDRQERRRLGKSDPLDAIAAARAVIAERDAGEPKAADGIVESIRMVRLVRRSATAMRTQTMNQLRAVLDTSPEPFRTQFAGLAAPRIITAALALQPGDLAVPEQSAAWTVRALAQRWQTLTDQITITTRELARLVETAAPSLCGLVGVGPDTAAVLLITAGDNPHRLHHEAAFAALCGVSPIPAGSGHTRPLRHRLNTGGNRDANNALWRIAMVRMAHDPRTRDYVTRRQAEGLSKREIIRCLKRYIAREAFHHLPRSG
jgi:transposase